MAKSKPATDPKTLTLQLSDLKGYARDGANYVKKHTKPLQRHGLIKEYERAFDSVSSSNPTLGVVSVASSFTSVKNAKWAMRYLPKAAGQTTGKHTTLTKVTVQRFGQQTVAFKLQAKENGEKIAGLVIGIRFNRYVGVVAGLGLKGVFQPHGVYPLARKQVSRLKLGK